MRVTETGNVEDILTNLKLPEFFLDSFQKWCVERRQQYNAQQYSTAAGVLPLSALQMQQQYATIQVQQQYATIQVLQQINTPSQNLQQQMNYGIQQMASILYRNLYWYANVDGAKEELIRRLREEFTETEQILLRVEF